MRASGNLSDSLYLALYIGQRHAQIAVAVERGEFGGKDFGFEMIFHGGKTAGKGVRIFVVGNFKQRGHKPSIFHCFRAHENSGFHAGIFALQASRGLE